MSSFPNNKKVVPAVELREAMTGSRVLIGTLLGTPQKLIFDNQGTVDVEIFFDSETDPWHTFPGGEAIILDQDLGAFPKGTRIYGNGASGNFSVSYTYYQE